MERPAGAYPFPALWPAGHDTSRLCARPASITLCPEAQLSVRVSTVSVSTGNAVIISATNTDGTVLSGSTRVTMT